MIKKSKYEGNEHNCSNCYWGIFKLRPWKENPKEDELYFECEKNHKECKKCSKDLNCKYFRPQEYTVFETNEDLKEYFDSFKIRKIKVKKELFDIKIDTKFKCDENGAVILKNKKEATKFGYLYNNFPEMKKHVRSVIIKPKDGKVERFFGNVYGLEQLPIVDMRYIKDASEMFQYQCRLKSIKLINCYNLENAESMFSDCSSLKSIKILDKQVITPKLTDCESICLNCDSLIATPNFDYSMVENMGGAFMNCKELETITFNDISSADVYDAMFFKCKKIKNYPKKMYVNNKNEENGYVFDKHPKAKTLMKTLAIIEKD